MECFIFAEDAFETVGNCKNSVLLMIRGRQNAEIARDRRVLMPAYRINPRDPKMYTFDTHTQSGRDRFEFWHDVVCQTYARCDSKPGDRRTFCGHTEVSDLGAGQIMYVRSDPVSYGRTSRDAKIDDRDDIFLAVMLSGEGRFSQNGRSVRQSAGDVLLYEAGRPYAFDFGPVYASMLLRLPREALRSRLMQIDGLGGMLLQADSASGAMAAGLIRNAFGVTKESDNPSLLYPSLVELLAVTLAQGAGIEGILGRGEADRLVRIKRWMLDHMADDGLSLETVSAEQHVSLRTLSRLFAQEKTTPMGWLQGQRLAAAHSAFAEGRARSVTETAFAVGFNDLSHFGRAFKRTYGRTPRQVMRDG